MDAHRKPNWHVAGGRHHLAPHRRPLSYLVPGRYPPGDRHRAPEDLRTYILRMNVLRGAAWL